MASEAVGEGPVAYVDDNGHQVSIPLDDIQFDGEDILVGGVAPDPKLEAWLKYLVKQQRIGPAPSAPLVTSMSLAAPYRGSNGNSITIEVTAAATTVDPTRVDIRVTARNVYTGLTLEAPTTTVPQPTFLTAVIGTAAAAGTRPGMVRLKGTLATPVVYPDDPSPGVAATGGGWDVKGPVPTTGATPVSFSLEASAAGSDVNGAVTTITVDTVRPAAVGKTFNLTVTWTHHVAIGATDLASARTALAPLAFGVAITLPTTGTFKPPMLGTYSLSGGVEPTDAVAATATLLAIP